MQNNNLPMVVNGHAVVVIVIGLALAILSYHMFSNHNPFGLLPAIFAILLYSCRVYECLQGGRHKMTYNGIEYTQPEHKQFIEDMQAAGLEPYIYHGRYYWHGPAVDVSDLQDALSYTKVACQWDNMGLDFVVYPKVSDSSLKGLSDDVDEGLD